MALTFFFYFFSVFFLLSFVLQLISLAGLHSTATVTCQWLLSLSASGSVSADLSHPPFSADELATQFKTDGMLAYVKLIQQKEKAIGCDVLTHQKWSVWRPRFLLKAWN